LKLEGFSAPKAYIVAVANSNVNTGISDIDQYGTEKESTLLDLLEEADTYDKFQKITLLRPDANDVNVYASRLTMTGCYQPKGAAANSEIQPVTITESDCVLDGCIKLTRVIAYNKFIIVPGPYVNLKLNTWQVCNVPHGCYLLNQDTNVGDKFTDKAGGGFYNSTLASHSFTATTNASGVEGHSFEFYQLENKHTAVEDKNDSSVGINPNASDFYTEREREFKSDNLNTGIYHSLVASADQEDLSNNHASYVVVNATIDYYVAAPTSDEDTFDATTAEPIDPSSDVKKIHRTAIVNYTIHLGYCEGKNDDDTPSLATAQDFNCRRNTKYTYNVTINGVKNVVVEAKSEDGSEPQPGAEGWVSDEYGDYEELDSHYCEFNISLTDEERANMSYRITAPYGNSTYIYYKKKDGTVEMTSGMNKELYSWIKFYPTTAKDVLAKYDGGKNLWSLDDLCGENRKTDGATADSDGNQWYTVFVDEYVYHIGEKIIGYDEYDPSIPYYDETSWANYVNKDDRIVEFLMHMDESKDTESSYSYCKYAFGQKAIQSYYKGVADANGNNTGIGVEHTEETYCMNMYWDFLTGGWDGERNTTDYSYSNGRYNLYHYVDTKVNEKSWDKVIQQTKPAHVDADSNPSYGTSHPAADYPVYMPTSVSTTRIGNLPSPKDGNTYYANSICMNRNRDLNGDGVIEPNEIRWYLPTSSIYMQIAIAQNELPDPIMPLTDYDENYFDWNNKSSIPERFGTYIFHYITSDYQYYWAELYLSTGDNPFSGYASDASSAYTARCVRNLGTKPSVEPTIDTDEVGYAYKHDADAHTFTMDNFTDVTLRGYNLGGLAPHDLSDPADRPYKKFEYSKTYCTNITGNEISVNSNGYIQWGSASSSGDKIGAWSRSVEKNDICGKYYQNTDKSDKGEWRVPTLCEMSFLWTENIMQNMGSYSLCATHEYFVTYNLKDEAKYKYTFLGYNNYWNRKVLASDILYGGNGNPGSVRIRCVRDVKQ
jgi:hypothetical protein